MATTVLNEGGTHTTRDSLTKLFLLFVLYQLILHSYFAFSIIEKRVFFPTAVAFFQDISILAITAAIGHGVKSVSGPKLKKTVDILYSMILIFIGIALASYPRILREYLVYSVNIFDTDMSSAQVFISDYLGIDAFLPSLIALVIGVIAVCIKKEVRVSRKFKINTLTVILLVFGFSLLSFSPQPYIYSLQKKIEIFLENKPRVVASLSKVTPKEQMGETLDKLSFTTQDSFNYNHIIIVVMEGVTSDNFEKDFLSIKDGFYQENKNHSVYYKNFYTSNLDSYTSLISMITSIQAPFRAYADESLYTRVNNAPSIAQHLQKNGFYNLFISTYEYQPFVPTRDHWDDIYERKDLPSIKGWMSLESSRMESATEDKAAIPTIVDKMSTNSKTFILHELVYGHSSEWNAITGKNKITYYDEYLKALQLEIEKDSLEDNTLFIIVSDHGDRSKSSVLENYRVPLLIVGSQESTREREELISHTDVPAIINQYVCSKEAPQSHEEMLLVGSTEKWVYGKMTEDKEYLFIDDASGTILSQEGSMDPVELHRQFQSHVDRFNTEFGKIYVNPKGKK